MAEDISQEMIGKYYADIEEIDRMLNSQLQTLSEQVDSVFGAISQTLNSLTQLALESTNGLVSNRTRSKIEVAGVLASGVAKAVAEYHKKKKIEEKNVKTLKEVKQPHAIVYAEEIKRVKPTAERAHRGLQRILMSEARVKRQLSEFETTATLDRLIDNMDSELDMYRKAVYQELVMDYLLEEYSAWLYGEQTSGKRLPDYYDVNCVLVKLLEQASGEEATEKFINVFEGNPKSVSGSTIYYLMDSQLASTVISSIDGTYSFSAPRNECLRHLIDGNAGIEHYMAAGNRLEEAIDEGPEQCFYSWRNTLGVAALLIALLIILDASWWWSLLVGIVALMVGQAGSQKNDLLEKVHDYNVYLESKEIKQCALQDAGRIMPSESEQNLQNNQRLPGN